MTTSDAVKIMELKVKVFAIAAITTMVSVALWQGHNGVALATGVGAIVAAAGVKVYNKVSGG